MLGRRAANGAIWGGLRIAVGMLWLLESSLKFNNYYLAGGFAAEVARVAGPGDPLPWYAYLIHHLFIPDAAFFGPAKTLAEMAVGFCLVFGVAVPWACGLAIFMNVNFFLAAGWVGDVHYFVNLLLAFLEAAFIRLRAGDIFGLGAIWNQLAGEEREGTVWLGYLRLLLGLLWLWAALDLAVGWASPARLLGDLRWCPWTFLRPVAALLVAHPGGAVICFVILEVLTGVGLAVGWGSMALWGNLLLCGFFFFATGWAEYLQYFYYALLALAGLSCTLRLTKDPMPMRN